MNLKQFYDKKVRILTNDEELFEGTVCDYFYPEDNDTEEESIVVDTGNEQFIEFYPSDIKKIIVG